MEPLNYNPYSKMQDRNHPILSSYPVPAEKLLGKGKATFVPSRFLSPPASRINSPLESFDNCPVSRTIH